MGFTTGFVRSLSHSIPPTGPFYTHTHQKQTGGVTLVLGTAYLTLQAHQRTRAQQAETLRAQAYVLNSLSYVPASAPKPQTIAEELALLEYQQELLAAGQQARRRRHFGDDQDRVSSFLRRAKARWNAEVEGAVRWASTKDWTAAREDAERAAARVWARATGGEQAGAPVQQRTRDAAELAREGAARAGDVAWLKADEAKEAAGSIWERGFRRGKEAVGKAKAAVGLAEESVAAAVSNGVNGVKSASSPQSEAERVIQQRYERTPEQVMSRTAEEVLEDRYKPMGQ